MLRDNTCECYRRPTEIWSQTIDYTEARKFQCNYECIRLPPSAERVALPNYIYVHNWRIILMYDSIFLEHLVQRGVSRICAFYRQWILFCGEPNYVKLFYSIRFSYVIPCNDPRNVRAFNGRNLMKWNLMLDLYGGVKFYSLFEDRQMSNGYMNIYIFVCNFDYDVGM